MPTPSVLLPPPPPPPATEKPAQNQQPWQPLIWSLLIGTFLTRAAGFVYPYLALHLAGHGVRHVSTVLALFGAGWLAGQVVSGTLADRIGRPATLAGSLLTAAGVFPLLAHTSGLLALSAAAFSSGACYDAPRPVVTALIADTVTDESARARIAGWRHFAVNLGAATTGAVGGLLIQPLGTGALFTLNAVVYGLVAVVVLLTVPPSAPSAPGGAHRHGHHEAFADPRLWLLWLASLCGLIPVAALFSSLPLMMQRDGLSAAAYGQTQVVSAVAVLVLSPLLNPWLSRRAAGAQPLVGTLALGALILGAGIGSAGFASTPASYATAAAAAVPGEIILFVAASDICNRISPPHLRGQYAGIWGTTLAAAVIGAPLLAGWATATGGDHLVGLATLACGLLGAALCLPLAALLHRPVASPDLPSVSHV
ncbi:MFS transporter [Streptomyces sp. NPDC095817]|uniref:MFS transporter n=1 Tax=Streptomyces sp. NPDC095817 TaxID=3155082 RepID=UPI00331FA2BF